MFVLVFCLLLSVQERHGSLGMRPEEGNKAVKYPKHKSYGEWMTELGLFSLEKKGHRGDFTTLYTT